MGLPPLTARRKLQVIDEIMRVITQDHFEYWVQINGAISVVFLRQNIDKYDDNFILRAVNYALSAENPLECRKYLLA
jgi:hypothetical protein